MSRTICVLLALTVTTACGGSHWIQDIDVSFSGDRSARTRAELQATRYSEGGGQVIVSELNPTDQNVEGLFISLDFTGDLTPTSSLKPSGSARFGGGKEYRVDSITQLKLTSVAPKTYQGLKGYDLHGSFEIALKSVDTGAVVTAAASF